MTDLFDPSTAPLAAPPSRLRRHGAGWLGLMTGVFMAMGLALIIAAQLYQDRGTSRDQAQAASVNLTNAIARDVSRQMELFRFVLSSLRDTLSSDGLSRIPPDMRDTVLFAHSIAPRALGVLFYTDAQGTIIGESGDNDIRGQSRGWRQYFLYHRDHQDMGLLFSGPIVSATNGAPVVVLSMRLNNPDGSFRGIVVGSMLLSYFDGLLSDINLEPGSSLSLLMDQGVVLARRPAMPDGLVADVSRPPPGAEVSTTTPVTYIEPVPLPDTHLVVSTAVEGTPLRVQMVQPLSRVQAPWRAKAWIIGSTTIILLLGIVGLVVVIHRESMQRAQAQRALAEANAALERMATTDPLTGIPNRRMFDDVLRREEVQIAAGSGSAAILMIDIDLFKSFNDTYGHGAGDATLRSVAQAVTRAVTRKGDLVARIGGEEFAVLLAQTDLAGARAVAERARAAVAALGIRHSTSPHGHVTISIGLATANTDASPMTLDEALNKADQALYAAKKNGRNRIEQASPSIVAA